MAICGNCGAETSRLTVKVTIDGQPLKEPKESCPKCDGSTEVIHSITDRKLWLGHEAYPEHYTKTRSEDGQIVYKASDSMIADLVQEWSKDPDEELERKMVDGKRRNRRTNPLTPAEIEAEVNRIRKLDSMQRALDAGLVIPI